MKIGILGTRGIPNAYGGFEQFAQYLAKGLQERQHEVYVYNSSEHPYKGNEWKGISIIHCKDWEGQIGTPGQFIYDYNCLVDARKRKFDILLQLGYTSSSVWYWLWPGSAVNIVNMDGLEWKRAKYKKATRKFLQMAEGLAAKHADILISDSIGIQDYITKKYNKDSLYIPYGAEIPSEYRASILNDWHLKKGNYLLVIARMEPENNIETIIKGYLDSSSTLELVIIGSTANRFGSYLKDKYRDKQIRFLGAIYDSESTNVIRHFSKIYLHGHSVGGTNPSLLEAMACECNIIAHNNSFNKTILQDDAFYFEDHFDITSILNNDQEDEIISSHMRKNLEKIRTRFNWEKIIDDYESVFLEALTQTGRISKQNRLV